ncbi:MAG TPA: phage holin family protein [Anaerolineales bacterium]|nr:phage holin family protein [Anaerolineales bacterium]HLE72640.1 phage holin family protein [Anaerolineales bacterium]
MESLWIVRLAVNAVALYAAIYLVPGLQGSVGDGQNWVTYVILGLIFGLVNIFIRPILKLVTCPFYILTLGLFSLIVNSILFWVTFWIGAQFGVTTEINTFMDAFLGALVVSIVSMLLYAIIPDDRPASSAKRPF